MNHKIKGRKFDRNTKQRKALLRSLVQALVTCEEIKTTEAKAKDLRPIIEKLITKGKVNSLHNRRVISAKLGGDDKTTKKIVDDLSVRYLTRNGGYTRIVKAGFRSGDSAPMSYIMLV